MNGTLSGSISALSSRMYKKRRFSTVWLSVDFTKEPSRQPTKKVQTNSKNSLWKRLNVAPQNLLKLTPISDKLSKGKRNSKMLKVLRTIGRKKNWKNYKLENFKHYYSLAEVTSEFLASLRLPIKLWDSCYNGAFEKEHTNNIPHLTLWKRRQSASK